MLSVSEVTKAFDTRSVLNGVTFELGVGEMVGLVGPGGGGKSVLLKIIGGVLRADSGLVQFEASKSNADGSLQSGFLFQEGALFDSMTVLENVAFPLLMGEHDCYSEKRNRGEHSKERRHAAFEQAYHLLRQVGLGDAIRKVPGELSGGMKRRVGIARALVGNPPIVLLDDPTGGLDPVASSVIIDLIQRLHQDFRPTVLIVSHDIRRLLPNVERVLALFDGRIVGNAHPDEIRSNFPPEVIQFLKTRYDFPSVT